MKQKKIFVAIVVLLIAATAAVIMSSCSCAGRLSDEEADSLVRTVWEENKGAADNVIVRKFEQKASFELFSVKKEGSSYILTYEITSPNIKEALAEYLIENRDEVANISELEESIGALVDNCRTVKIMAEVYIVSENSEYNVVFSDAFIDAMYGGIYSFAVETISGTEK